MPPRTGQDAPVALDVFESTFTPSRADYAALVRNAPLTWMVVASGWLALALCAALLAMAFLLVTDAGEPALSPELGAVSVGLLPVGIAAIFYARVAAILTWRRAMNREPVTALVNTEGIGHSGPSGKQFLSWSAAARARETAEAIYVYAPSGIATLVYWIPKSAVRAEDLAGLRNLIRAKVPRYRAH